MRLSGVTKSRRGDLVEHVVAVKFPVFEACGEQNSRPSEGDTALNDDSRNCPDFVGRILQTRESFIT